jgi:hypothetical protein
MRVPLSFVGPTYKARSVEVSAQETCNWYAESLQVGEKTEAVLLPMPGLLFVATIGLGPHRGSIEHDGKMYLVSGNEFYEIDTLNVATKKGTLNTAAGMVSMASSGSELILVDGNDGWIWDGSTFTQISDADFVDAQQVVFLDSYFIVNKPTTGEFYISDSYDGTSWVALDFATAEVDPDDLLALITDHRELWLLGQYTTEVYYNNGDSDFPFGRVSGGFIEWGIAASFSIAKDDSRVFWLARNRQGAGQVIAASGYTPQVISTRGVEAQIAGFSKIDDAIGWTMQIAGHSFYVLTFPTADKTLLYDMTENAWYCWQSYDLGRHRTNAHCFFNNKHYVGDYSNGKLYTLSLTTYKDDDDPIVRRRITSHVAKDGKRLFWGSVEIKFEAGVGLVSGQGSDPIVKLRWSDDGGHVWSNWRYQQIGKIGQYKYRAVFRRLGSSLDRLFELEFSEPVKAVVVDAWADVEVES